MKTRRTVGTHEKCKQNCRLAAFSAVPQNESIAFIVGVSRDISGLISLQMSSEGFLVHFVVRNTK